MSNPQASLYNQQELFEIWKRIHLDEFNCEVETDEQLLQALAEFAATVQYSAPGYENFQEQCKLDLERDEGPTMQAGADESAAQLFTDSFDVHNSTILSELIDTGSVTVHVNGKRFVVTLAAKEELP